MHALDRRRLVVSVAVLAVVAVVVGGAWFVRGLTAERRAAQERWDAHEPAAYSYRYFHCGGMCANCPVRVTVRDGEVVDAVAEEPGCSSPDPDAAMTIDDLFGIAARTQPWPFGDSTTVTYDSEWGFPALISTTCGPGTSDCGSSWSAADLRPLE